MALKFDGLVEPYTGRAGTEDWDDFWQKFLVLADISGWNSSKRMARLPLFLKGDAFKVFSKLPESLKADESQLPGVMRRSFSVSPGTAFKSFKERKMRVDEMPDVFVADLRRLLELAGHVPTDDDRDPVLLEQFLHGLPAEFEKELRLSSAGQSMKISACVEKVRALSACTARRSGGGFVAATASAARELSGQSANPEPAGKPSAMSSVLCFACKQVGHTRRFCPNKANRQHSVRCFFCDKPGHTKKVCPARQQWLSTQSQPRSTVAAVTDVESSSAAAVHRANESEAAKCLCTVSSVGGLPRIFVETSCSADFKDSLRARSVVDTGAARTMITADMLTRIGAAVEPNLGGDIVALDGKPLTVLGVAALHCRRLDGAVAMRPISVHALVVPNLDIICCDLLVGSDLITRCGGLHLEYSDNGTLSSVLFGPAAVANPVCGVTTPVASTSDREQFLKHVDVHEDVTSGNVTLTTDDGSVRWIADEKRMEKALRGREEDLLNSKREKDLQAWEARLRQKEAEVNEKLERAEKMLRDAEVVTQDGLPTNDREPASTSRVLGLQLYKADELTRIPLDWVKRFKARYDADVACASRQCVVGPVSLEQIARALEEHPCHDFVSDPRENPYRPDDPVQLLRPDRRQKCSAPYEPGWQVVDVISPSSSADPDVQSYNLRSRSTLQRPERYS